MKSMARRRARIARVRHVQHLQAAADAHAAERHALALEHNAARLAALRGTLAIEPGPTTGATLANLGELASRLDRVRDGLTDAIVGARATAEARAALRLEARRKQESADRLEERATQALADWIERRPVIGRPRRMRFTIGEDRS